MSSSDSGATGRLTRRSAACLQTAHSFKQSVSRALFAVSGCGRGLFGARVLLTVACLRVLCS